MSILSVETSFTRRVRRIRPSVPQILFSVSVAVILALTFGDFAQPPVMALPMTPVVASAPLDGESVLTATQIAHDSTASLLTTLGALDPTALDGLLAQHPELVARVHDDPPAADVVGAWWSALPGASQATLLSGAAALVGNLDGVAWGARFLANRTNIAAAHTVNADRIALLSTQLDSIALLSFASASTGTLLRQEISALSARNAIYDLMAKRQVLLFDPVGNGRYAEVHGTLTETTKNIGVIVNGTTLNMSTVLDYDLRALSFWEKGKKDAPGSLVTITWMGVDFPDWGTYIRSELLEFATEGAPSLVRFVSGLDAVSEARITLIGHSAGGVIIGAAEEIGLPADAIVHVSSAAAGPGVTSINDYADPTIARYTLTATADPVRIFQNLKMFGEDPVNLEGVTVLDAGTSILGNIPLDPRAHDAVFDSGSIAWKSLYNVLVGTGATETAGT